MPGGHAALRESNFELFDYRVAIINSKYTHVS